MRPFAPLLTSAAALAFLVASAARAQESAWSPAGEPFPAGGPEAVVERPGSELVADGARLLRRSGGRTAALACTDPAGTGAILDLALDPGGLVFVAAERGLYVVSAEVDALDPVRLQDGAPPGKPRSVHVDARRRVWIATDVAVGVVDPSFGWGRTLEAEDGLPGDGPYRLAPRADGSLLVETAAGTFRYRPDVGPEPVVAEVLVDGAPLAPGAAVTGRYGRTFTVEARGTASGGATFRKRLDRHHIWRALDGEPIEGVHPGAHELEVIAIDRDLRRSAPVVVPIVLDLPRQYGKGFVLGVGAFAAALVTAFFAWRARRAGGGGAWIRVPVSAAIALVLGVQVLAGIVPHAKGWPFIGFSMYTNTYGENFIVYDGGVFGIEPGGTTRKLDYHGVVAFADDRWQVIGPIVDGGPEFSREWVRRYNALHPGAAIVGLQARADRRRLTSEGPVRIAPLVFSSWRAPEGGPGGG